MNGHMYGWVDKEHCILLKPLPCDYKLITLNKMCPNWTHFRKRGEEESGI